MTAAGVALLQAEKLNLLLDTFKDTGSHCDGFSANTVGTGLESLLYWGVTGEIDLLQS